MDDDGAVKYPRISSCRGPGNTMLPIVLSRCAASPGRAPARGGLGKKGGSVLLQGRDEAHPASLHPILADRQTLRSTGGAHRHTSSPFLIRLTSTTKHPGCNTLACRSVQDQRHRLGNAKLFHPVTL